MRASAVLFDVGNVIVRWDPRAVYSQIFPDRAQCDRFLAEVCTMAWHGQFDRGLPMAQGVAQLSAQFPQHADAIAAWRLRFMEMVTGPIAQTTAAIEALHARGVPLYGLTNMPAEMWGPVQAQAPAITRLRDVIVSSAEGVIKPDRRIYEIVCERTGLAPQDLLFVDDNAANIDAARDFGMDVHLFEDPDALEPALRARGLL